MPNLLKSSVAWLVVWMLSLTLWGVDRAAADVLQQVQARGQLNVCIWPDYFAISYRNPRTQVLEGLDIDMAEALADSLQVKLNFVDSSFAQLISNLTEGHCDVAMHGVGVRADRTQYLDFSQPYLRSGIYAVVNKNTRFIRHWQDIDQPGNVVVVMAGTYMEPVMREQLKQATLRTVDNFKAREEEVMSGRADVLMTDYPYGKRMVSLTSWAQLLAPPQALAPTDYAYAVKKGEQGMLVVLNRFLQQVQADGRLQAAAQRAGLTAILLQ